MNMALIGMAVDFVILLALAGTIYYAMRLSRSLEGFRAHREALKGMIGELSQNVEQAQRAIEGLKNASRNGTENLDEALRDARRMAEELKMVNEASEGLAGRLEKLAERNRKAAQDMNGPGEFYMADNDLDAPHRPARAGSVDMPSFAIHDRDAGDDYGFDAAGAADEDEEGGGGGESGEFASQAERDLYEALRRNRRQTNTGGG